MWNSGFFALVFPTETFDSPAARDSQTCVENQFKTQHNWIRHHTQPAVEIHASASATGQMMNGRQCLGRFCSPEHIALILNVREQVVILLPIMGMWECLVPIPLFFFLFFLIAKRGLILGKAEGKKRVRFEGGWLWKITSIRCQGCWQCFLPA